MSLPVNQIVCGDCIEVMKSFPEESIDCVVTDPPYGIGFMGKKWDQALPPEEAFREMFRVLKPGALAFVMSSPRQDVLWRMLRMLEECGFELKQSFVSWIYKSGFPKAYDVSKGIDKKRRGNLEKTRSILRKHLSKYKRTILAEKLGVTVRQIDHWIKEEETQPQIPSYEQWQLIKQLSDFSEEELLYLDYKKSEYDYEVIGVKGYDTGKRNIPVLQGNTEILETKPTSDLAKKWQGWKAITGLKPALECVLMVNKPLRERTIVDNVLKHGVGAINVDACRIPINPKVDDMLRETERKQRVSQTWEKGSGFKNEANPLTGVRKEGRFPANLLVSDRALDTGKTSKSGAKLPHHQMRHPNYGIYGKYAQSDGYYYPEDVGDQSRYFDLDAWAEHHGFLDVPKASKSERDKGLENMPYVEMGSLKGSNDGSLVGQRGRRKEGKPPLRRNIHPTVKPIKLMAYLIELGCPRQGILLDPFVGSGTTCIAAKRLKRKWIGIEVNKEYVQIAEARIQSPKGLESFFV